MLKSSYENVVLGGGVVAGYAAQEFIEHGLRPGELCIVSADNTPPYERPPLSKGFLAGEKSRQDILINEPEFYQHYGITLSLDTLVDRVDLEARELHTRTGERIGFEKLLIATGSYARTLDISGARLDGIFYLRWDDDALQILQAHESPAVQNIVVIGGGYIGMETSAILASKGINVTMVFPKERLMQKFFTPAMSSFFQAYYRERGVKFMPTAKPVAFTGSDWVDGVVLDTGQELTADAVVIGIGAEPNTDLFLDTALNIRREGGIIVNKYLETNLPGIYAAGDVANYYDMLYDKRRRVEHWQNAVEQGRHAARAMITGKREMFMHIPYFFSDVFDLSYEVWGDPEGFDQVIHRGHLESGGFSVWWLRNGCVIAAFVMNRPDEEREIAPEWIKMRHRPNVELLKDKTVSLLEVDRSIA